MIVGKSDDLASSSKTPSIHLILLQPRNGSAMPACSVSICIHLSRTRWTSASQAISAGGALVSPFPAVVLVDSALGLKPAVSWPWPLSEDEVAAGSSSPSLASPASLASPLPPPPPSQSSNVAKCFGVSVPLAGSGMATRSLCSTAHCSRRCWSTRLLRPSMAPVAALRTLDSIWFVVQFLSCSMPSGPTSTAQHLLLSNSCCASHMAAYSYIRMVPSSSVQTVHCCKDAAGLKFSGSARTKAA
mmetsp:Transcript_99643/g.281962  ORF Transcript_99643/g.281962 Transcript_99643/m.281962 type:complete len:244 (-) Transcript_99643:863-1594(-)